MDICDPTTQERIWIKFGREIDYYIHNYSHSKINYYSHYTIKIAI